MEMGESARVVASQSLELGGGEFRLLVNLVGLSGRENFMKLEGDQVRRSHQSALVLQSGFESFVITLRFRILLPGGAPGALDQDSFRPGIPLSGLATFTLARALIVPRTD